MDINLISNDAVTQALLQKSTYGADRDNIKASSASLQNTKNYASNDSVVSLSPQADAASNAAAANNNKATPVAAQSTGTVRKIIDKIV